MAALQASGDEGLSSDQEVEVDIMSPQRTLSEGGETNEIRPISIPIPYDPEFRRLGATRTDSLEVNMLASTQDFERFLKNKGEQLRYGLTASLKYMPGVCDELVANVINCRIFRLQQKLLLWFHMSLEEPSAVVPESDVEVVLVRSHKDLAELQPSGRAHCYALVLEWERPREGQWTVISLKAGFSTAFMRLRRFIGATEKRVRAAATLFPSYTQLSSVLSEEQLAIYKEITDLECYVRNPKNLAHLQPILNPVVAHSPVLQLAISRLQPSLDTWTSERITTFGTLSGEPATTVEWELRTGSSPKEAHLRELGSLLPIHDIVAFLRFPNAKPKACKSLERIIYLLLTFLHRDYDDYKVAYRLLHVRYLMDGADALILISANWLDILRLFRIIKNKNQSAHIYYMTRPLDAVSLLPKDHLLHRVSLQVQEPLKDLMKKNSSTSALKLTSSLTANSLWTDVNSRFAGLSHYLESSVSQQEVTQERANEVVEQWFAWLNRCGKVGSRSARTIALHIFEQLEDVVGAEEVELEAYGPGFYGHGKAVVKEIGELCKKLKFPKDLK